MVTGVLPQQIKQMTQEMMASFDQLYASEKGLIPQLVMAQFNTPVLSDSIHSDPWTDLARENLATFLEDLGEEDSCEDDV